MSATGFDLTRTEIKSIIQKGNGILRNKVLLRGTEVGDQLDLYCFEKGILVLKCVVEIVTISSLPNGGYDVSVKLL